MAKKKFTVRDALELMDKEQKVDVDVYAYGIHYASTLDDGIETAEKCLEKVRYDILQAKVTKIGCVNFLSTSDKRDYVRICCEMID